MKDSAHELRVIHVRALAQDAGQVAGAWPQSALPRLTEGLFVPPAESELVHWSAQASLRAQAGLAAQIWLHLKAAGSVSLQCQRCLQAVTVRLDVDRHYRFVHSEEEAERLDEVSEEEILVLTPRLDLQELVEDELILSLPLVPRHVGLCPVPLPLPVDDLSDESPKPNPFAALAALRKSGGGPGGPGVH